jgi:hypothetical protein
VADAISRDDTVEPRTDTQITCVDVARSRKALAIAAHANGHGYGTTDGIYDIEVEELGPAARDERGLAVIEGHLSDRMEF